MATGLCQYVRWDDDPDAANPLTSFGLGATGGSGKSGGEPEERTYAGGTAAFFGKMQEYQGSVEFDPTDLTPLALAFRSPTGYPCSALPGFALGIASDGVLHRFNGCIANSLKLSAEVGGVLQATLDWLALSKVEGTPGSPAAATGTGWQWSQMAVLVAGQALYTQSFEVTLENSVEALTDLDGGADAGNKRDPKRFRVGHERVSLSVKTQRPLSATLTGHLDDSILSNLTASAVFTKGSAVLTIALAHLAYDGDEVPIVGDDGQVEYNHNLRAPANAGALSLTLS